MELRYTPVGKGMHVRILAIITSPLQHQTPHTHNLHFDAHYKAWERPSLPACKLFKCLTALLLATLNTLLHAPMKARLCFWNFKWLEMQYCSNLLLAGQHLQPLEHQGQHSHKAICIFKAY